MSLLLLYDACDERLDAYFSKTWPLFFIVLNMVFLILKRRENMFVNGKSEDPPSSPEYHFWPLLKVFPYNSYIIVMYV